MGHFPVLSVASRIIGSGYSKDFQRICKTDDPILTSQGHFFPDIVFGSQTGHSLKVPGISGDTREVSKIFF